MSEENEQVLEIEKEVVKEVKKEIDIDGLKKVIAESIRKEEKDKLYPEQKKLKEQLAEKEKSLVELQDKLKSFESGKLTDDEKIQLKLKELEDAKNAFDARLESVADQAAQEIHKIRIESEIEKQLLKYRDEVIPQLVVGNTVEEIRENAEVAHNEYVKIFEKALEGKKDEPIGTGIDPITTTSTSDIGEFDFDKYDPTGGNKAKEAWEADRKKLLSKAFEVTARQ